MATAPLWFRRWFDSWSSGQATSKDPERVDWPRSIPFILLHLACLFVLVVPFTWGVLIFAAALYVLRMFAITAFYHRYFSHRSFKAGRVVQFLMAVAGATAVQRGAMWWAAHHREHHRHSDTEEDTHSPKHGFWWSHCGWILTEGAFRTKREFVPDLEKFPELCFLDRYDGLVPVLFFVSMFGFGVAAAHWMPSLGIVSGWQALVYAIVSTVVCHHGTFTINSLAHVFGGRRYETEDTSRNHILLALITLGEGWHNNHHHYQSSARQGFRWWEVDISFYGLWMMSRLGLVSDLKPVPVALLNRAR